ncbi:MAG TPA: glycoside hydrolase family 27 protein, partial [Verrucomicrobiae bacterium]|nr:glycoside hydrolase family 27 protein [Verrucomicrobiae bacterium]
GIQGHCGRQVGPTQIWTKALADGGTAVALLNLNNHSMEMTASFNELGLPARVTARDLWRRENLGTFDRKCGITVPAHGSVLVKMEKQ